MTKAHPIQTAFNAGEFSPLMEGQINLEKRASAGLLVQNLIPLKQGPLIRRGRTNFVAEVKDSAKRTHLIDFEFSTVQAYQIEVGDQYFRFYRDNGQIISGTAYEIASPYVQADLFDTDGLFQIMYAQKADVIYLLHANYAPRALTRTGHTSWTLSTVIFDDGPYLDLNTTATTLTLSGTSGSVTVTASAITGINNNTGFQVTDIGRLIRWKDPANNWTWLTITARTSTTQVTATISGANASAGTATANWRLGVYSATTGYPTVISFFQDRLVLASNDDYPDRWDMTIPAGYSSTTFYFEPTEANGTVTDNNAISGTLQSGSVNKIVWMSSDEKGLIIGTVRQEWIIRPDTNNGVITPTNATSSPISSIGGAYIKPLDIESGTLFVQRARRRLLDVIYSFEVDRLKPRDLTLAAEHITKNQIVGYAFQQEPLNCIWAYTGAGLLIGLTYYPDQAVFGWHRHIIGGSFEDGEAVVECASVIPSPDGSRDELWLIVKRTINGATKRYVEYMSPYYDDETELSDAAHVDSALSYSGVATATVTGLDHLEGETVRVMVDGKSHPDLIVTGGAITLANSRTASKITAGLAYKWAFKSMQIEAGATDGTAQGKTKRITGFILRLLNTLGLKFGESADSQLDEYDFNQGQSYNETPELFTGDTEFLRFPAGYTQSGHIYLEDDGVFPACILATMPRVVTNEK